MEINITNFATIDSTNNWVKRNTDTLPVGALNIIAADEQTAGRGRFNRKWLSPNKMNIYVTYHFTVAKHLPIPIHVSQIIAVSACKVLVKKGLHPKIKWPNDLLIEKRKVGGILCESVQNKEHTHMIVGIGLNVNMTQELLDQIDQPATSLYVLTQKERSVETVLEALNQQFHDDLELFLKEGFPLFLPYLQEHTAYLDEVISFHDGRTLWEGTCLGLDDSGNLILALNDGTTKSFYSGEILFT